MLSPSLVPSPASARRLLLALLLTAALLGACRIETGPTPPDNVVVVLVDTLRRDRLGLYGYGRGTTPRLDRLAARSVVFQHARAASSWTKPSVASLFTGLYPAQHGVMSSRQGAPHLGHLGQDRRTLAERLRAAGFETAAFVTNPHIVREHGFDRGFDEFLQPAGKAADLLESAEEWLAEREGRFFLYLHLIDPHSPYTPPEPERERFLRVEPGDGAPFTAVGDPIEVAAWAQRFAEWRRSGAAGAFQLDPADLELHLVSKATLHRIARDDPEVTRENLHTYLDLDFDGLDDPELRRRAAALEDLYDGEIAGMDRALGEFLDRLDASGLRERTLLVFVSDHGEAFLEHGYWGHKNTVHAEEVDVPLMVSVPREGGWLTGEVERAVSLVDLYPTLLDLLGLPVPAGLDGRSLRCEIEGGPDCRPGDVVFSELVLPRADQVAATHEGVTVIRSELPDGTVEWTGRDAAGNELAVDAPAARRLAEAIEAQVRGRREVEPGNDGAAPPSEELTEQLRELGYL